MRMSCNGCRVLRKGCSDSCSIRPCLQWIKSPEAQANATVFLAKFYGRAGLLNLINAGPEHLRPAIFRSLLHEACGRIVNPIYGSVGLLWSGSWHLCQAAVESVLKGLPVTPIAPDAAADAQCPPFKACDIRHVPKGDASAEKKRAKTRCRSKRGSKQKESESKAEVGSDGDCCADEVNRSTSHDSSLSHQSELVVVDGESKETESTISAETAEMPILFRPEPEPAAKSSPPVQDRAEMGLDLSLGLKPVSRANHVVPMKKRKLETFNTCQAELGLDCSA